jgi:hypothetical protein
VHCTYIQVDITLRVNVHTSAKRYWAYVYTHVCVANKFYGSETFFLFHQTTVLGMRRGNVLEFPKIIRVIGFPEDGSASVLGGECDEGETERIIRTRQRDKMGCVGDNCG